MSLEAQHHTASNQSVRHMQESAVCKHDFTDNEGFMAKKWGPFMWHMMHVYGVYADRVQVKHPHYRKIFKKWIAELTAVLFCSTCRQRFEMYLAIHPLTAFEDMSKSCADLTFEIHNVVNCKLGRTCMSESNFDTQRQRYETLLNYRDTGLLSPDWQLTFALILFLAALNFPASFNEELPRHRMLAVSYRNWIWMCFELIPDTDPTNSMSFARRCDVALQQVYRPRVTKDGVHHSHVSPNSEPQITFTTFLNSAQFTRESLYHWVYDLTTAIWGTPVFGTSCTETQAHLEQEYRFQEFPSKA